MSFKSIGEIVNDVIEREVMRENGLKTFYVSLVKDLIGCYIEFKAETKDCVYAYLASAYQDKNVWKLPWCSVYDEEQFKTMPDLGSAIIIRAKCGGLYMEDFQ